MPRRPPRRPSTPPPPSKSPAPPAAPDLIESLNALEEAEFHAQFLPSNRHTGYLCCPPNTASSRRVCGNVQPAEEMFISLDPPPSDSSEDSSREDALTLGLVGIPRTLPANYLVRFTTPEGIREEDLEACFKLVERTSSKDYKASSMGWSARRKKEEMKDKDMKYLLLTTSDGVNFLPRYRVDGFLSFMFTKEEEAPVVYVYEDIGREAGVEKAMLTVFARNEGGRRWYERMGYAVDEASPSPRRLRGGKTKEPDYYILSKRLVVEDEDDGEEEEEESKDEEATETEEEEEGHKEKREALDGKCANEEIDVEKKVQDYLRSVT
ncbi:hypothetical protein G7Y79_00018g045750 [Physcia stellaris]|nr:hypothetical protein G7Y79_00018g045750 [Physcia stellaris]